MNYQFLGAFYSVKPMVYIALAFLIAINGITAFGYCLMFIWLALILYVSIRIHNLKEKFLILKITENNNWIIYINGIPLKEKIPELKNPAFAIEQELITFFKIIFLIKTVAVLLLTILMVYQMIEAFQHSFGILSLLSILCFIIMLNTLFSSATSIIRLRTKKYIIEEVKTQSGSSWYRLCFVNKNNIITTALDELLSV